MNSVSGRAYFPDTAWTQVLQSKGGDAAATAKALDVLCRQYWPAIYGYVRALGMDREEAEDVAQEFVAEFILGEPLHRADQAVGRLRSYMKQSVRNFLAKRLRDAGRLKRGGGVELVSWEASSASGQAAAAAPSDQLYDREWALRVMEQAMARLRESYTARNKGPLFELLKPALAGADTLQPYAVIAQSAGVSEAQIKLEVHRARRRLADALRQEVAATVAHESEVDQELRYLLAVLSHEAEP